MKRAKYIPDNIVLSLASPDRIRSWSFGEIKKAETINYRTGRSERGGLFDEGVFGPEKDYQCYCGKYKGIRYKGIVCEKCAVEITRAIVRRDRMGHIELASPVAHIWFLRGIPSRMGLILDISLAQLEKVVYFAGYIVTSVDESERSRILRDLDAEFKLKAKDITDDAVLEKLTERFQETKKEIVGIQTYSVLSEAQYYTYSMKYSTLFEAGIGAETLYAIFKNIDLVQLEAELVAKQAKSDKASREKIEKRLSLVRQLITSAQRPEWMFVTTLPVIPPALRPMVALEGGRFATSDINDLYRRVINRNNRLRKLVEIGAPDVILRNEKRILQEAVDSLFDNSMKKSGNSALSAGQNRQLKSLADNLKGKHGLLRQNLLGKRVDYSGRSVIVVGPHLALDECGIPKHMALELFRPFVIAELLRRERAFNIRGANRLIEEAGPEVWEILEHVIEGKYVLLNRAPTLHRLSIQAFHPILIEGKAIQVHPMVCSAFNADFDGDQMAVHVPLSEEAQREARELIAANKNILKPQTGSPIATPAQDIVLGCFWMTKLVPGAKGEGLVFSSAHEAITAREYGHVDYQASIKVLVGTKQKYRAATSETYLETTIGRILFNSLLPADYTYINSEVKKRDLSQIIQSLVEKYGIDEVAILLDKIKDFGFRFATLSGTTFSMDEVRVPERKKDVIATARAKVAEINAQLAEGLITDAERYNMTIAIWSQATNDMAKILKEELGQSASIHDMITSGARGDISQLNQSAGMKGLIQNVTGESLDFPIISSYKEGQSTLEYFINATTARKGLSDTALKTASAGYLTRRLHDVAQDVVITEEDCGTKQGIYAAHEVIEGFQRTLADNLFGRVIAEPVKSADGSVLYKRNTLVTRDIAIAIQNAGVDRVLVRTPLTCEASYGICRHCYGLDMGRNILVRLGEAVGTIASQSIGEPGTQLTLRTTHSGGVVGRDITHGLPRIEELVERRTPKALAILAQNDGVVVDIRKSDETGLSTIEIAVSAEGRSTKITKNDTYEIPARRFIIVKKGDEVKRGAPLTDGSANPVELFELGGREAAQNYLINEVAKVYEMQSQSIARKHLEIVVRQMFCQCRVTDPGDSLLTTGQLVEYVEVFEQNAMIRERGGQEIKTQSVLMGITDVATNRRSWLSSASFQHTQRVLTAAAVRGTGDLLRGLKENVIIGNLIPAGTGMNPNFVDMSDIEEQTQSPDSRE